jgi:hypothetical protein
MVAGLLGFALALGIQQSIDLVSASEATPKLPVSLTRIRHALERPAPLRITLRESNADFHVEIRERPLYSPNLLGPVETLWSTATSPVAPGGLYAYEQRRRLGQSWTQPIFAVDLLSIGTAAQEAVAHARRSSAEKAARDEVRRALAEFCATHQCPER